MYGGENQYGFAEIRKKVATSCTLISQPNGGQLLPGEAQTGGNLAVRPLIHPKGADVFIDEL